jgi:hypothetical protein
MRLSISHDTTYHYEDQVRTSIQYLRMTPHDSERQQVLSWQLTLPRPVRGMRRGGGIEQMHAQVEVAPLVRVQQQ